MSVSYPLCSKLAFHWPDLGIVDFIWPCYDPPIPNVDISSDAWNLQNFDLFPRDVEHDSDTDDNIDEVDQMEIDGGDNSTSHDTATDEVLLDDEPRLNTQPALNVVPANVQPVWDFDYLFDADMEEAVEATAEDVGMTDIDSESDSGSEENMEYMETFRVRLSFPQKKPREMREVFESDL